MSIVEYSLDIKFDWPDLESLGGNARWHGGTSTIVKRHRHYAYITALNVIRRHPKILRVDMKLIRAMPIRFFHFRTRRMRSDEFNVHVACKAYIDGIQDALRQESTGFNDKHLDPTTYQRADEWVKKGFLIVAVGNIEVPIFQEDVERQNAGREQRQNG